MTMKINEWEIWHTYSTYLQVSDIDLDLTARRLVELGIVQCAMLRDGQTYWRCQKGVGSGNMLVRLDPDGSRGSIKLEKHQGSECDLEGFTLEALGQAAHFRFNELRVFGEDSAIPPPYIRGFVGQCNFVSTEGEEKKIRCYPVLLLYESGVLLLELRTIAPEHQVPLEDFIPGAVNLFRHDFDKIEVPPGISILASRAYYHSLKKWNFLRRLVMLYLEREHDRSVQKLTINSEEGDFVFELAPLGRPKGNREKLISFALTMFNIIGFIIGNPRSGIAFLLRGQRIIPVMGNYWSGRPHIYLTRFEDQKETAKENEESHGPAFGSILARVVISDPQLALRYLPNDSRAFNDYSAYVTSAATLWVWSLSGLRQQEPMADPNRGHLIYEHQATSEILEYGYMIHRSLLECVNSYFKTDEVFFARRALLYLDIGLNEGSHSGEIRKLLNNGWRELGLESLKNQIKEALSIREAETKLAEKRSTEKIGRTLSVLFGLVAVPSLAKQVLQPLWELIGLHRPSNDVLFFTMLNAVSLGLVAPIVILLLWQLRKTKFPDY